jgi:hypothetical protein
LKNQWPQPPLYIGFEKQTLDAYHFWSSAFILGKKLF